MEKELEAIIMQLGQINANFVKLSQRVEALVIDLGEFAERFEEVVLELEAGRRADLYGEFN